jgi:cytochrome P450
MRSCPVGERTAPPRPVDPSGMRSYEVYQRLRVHETTTAVVQRQLWSAEFLDDPYPSLQAVRELTPCYRDWIGNAFWVTRYDDVTSVYVDDANFETRTRRWVMGLEHRGRDLGQLVPVLQAEADRTDHHVEAVAERLVRSFEPGTSVDLARSFAARLPIELLGAVLDLPDEDLPSFAADYLRLHRGAGWDARHRHAALAAFDRLSTYFSRLLEDRRAAPGDDLVSVIAGLELADGSATGDDVVATLLEHDHETLHGGLANLWYHLLVDRDVRDEVGDDRRLMKTAWLETLRHTPPVTTARRWTRHEVERFGRLLPEGALVLCSAAAANRDPRVFDEPDRFHLGRKDLCQREPRGHYRADGLPAGISFGTGAPSRFPAVPEDRPRSRYALVRDTAVTASDVLQRTWPGLRLDVGAEPRLRALEFGGMRTCWSLRVEVGR